MTGHPLAPDFRHLHHLTDAIGLHEHALYAMPRPEHGYCVDDVARALVVVTRAQGHSGLTGLRGLYLDFVLRAMDESGQLANRRDRHGRWTDSPTLEDHWGRGMWALGVVTGQATDPDHRDRARAAFLRAAHQRSPWPRARAYAGLGAAAVLSSDPGCTPALDLLCDAAARSPRPVADLAWPWPEPRLTYANAVLPELLIAAGHAMQDATLLEDGLALLAWLLSVQERHGHLSVVPASGWGPADLAVDLPGFDQQPIEVAALTEACERAHAVTGEPRWRAAVERAADWFLGANDVGAVLHDPRSGGGFDGLERHGVNLNQGAESTLALLSTWQLVSTVAVRP